MKKIFFYISFMLLGLVLITSQTVYSQSKTLRFNHINTEFGLPKNQVFSLYQDHIGFIWTGTGEGLSRYDGYRFKTYNDKNNNLFGNDVRIIYEDEENVLWLGTNKGLSKFNRVSESFENFVIDSALITGNKNHHINAFLEDNNGKFWIGTDAGLVQFDKTSETFKNNWSDHPLKKDIDNSVIRTIYQDTDNRIWMGSDHGLFVMLFDSNQEVKKILNYTFAPKAITSSRRNNVNAIVEDKKGTIWFATRIGLYKLNKIFNDSLSDISFSKIQNPFKRNEDYFDMMSSLVVDSNKGLWIGYLNGLYYLPDNDNDMENVDIITDDPRLKHNYSSNVQFIDNSGVLWLSSKNGIYKHDLNLKKFNIYRANQSDPQSTRQNLVWSIFKDSKNETWIGTTYGLIKLVWSNKTNNYEYHHIPNNEEKSIEKIGSPVHGILELDNNYLLVSSTSGLYKLNRRTLFFTEIPIQISEESKNESSTYNLSSKMCWGDENIIWMGTTRGLFKYNSRKNKFNHYELPTGLDLENNNRITMVYLDKKKRLWVGTHSGINVFLPKEEKFYPIKFKANTNFKSVWTVHNSEDGTIWFATWGSGLYHLIPKGNELNLSDGYNIKEYHVKDGLPNEYIYAILPDEEGNLWMSTNLGLSKFNPSTEEFENYTANDGLQSNEFNSGAYFKAKDGEMLFGGPSGINSFYPSDVFKNKIIPKVVITGLWVNNKEVLIPKKGNEKITLEYGQTPIKFDFAALSFNHSSKNKYLIKVENYDESWIDLENHTSFTLSKIPPGDYTFKVKGSNSDGYWNEEAAILNFTVSPPYWKTWWFYTLVSLIMFGIIYTVFKEYLKQQLLIRKDEENTVMMKEIHHRVKNNLQIVSSLLKFQSNEVTDENVKAMFKKSQERIISMARLHEQLYKAEDLKLINVKTHFTTLIQGLIHEYQVGVNIKLDIKVEAVNLGIKTLVPLGLMINELITNSLKYAFKDKKEGVIMVHLKHLEGLKHELIIGDNGIGLKEKSNDTGLGTELIEIFAEQLEGSIERLDKEGTVFRVVFEKIDK